MSSPGPAAFSAREGPDLPFSLESNISPIDMAGPGWVGCAKGMCAEQDNGPSVKKKVSFRDVREEDYPGICRMVRDEEELFLANDKGTYPFTVEQLKELLRRREEPTALMAEGVLAGFADFYRLRKARSVFIGNVMIDPAHRGKGLGRRLMEHMIRLAFVDHDLPKVRVHVYSRNQAALLLYGQLGFKPYGMKIKPDYRGKPAVLLSLSLTRPPGDPAGARLTGR